MGALLGFFLDWRVLLALGVAAFIGWNRWDAGRAARAERDALITATEVAHEERRRTNAGWADYARTEGEAAAQRDHASAADLAALKTQLAQRRPAHVPPPAANAAPRVCDHVSRGFVLHHDAAATATGRSPVPDAALAPDGAAGGAAADRPGASAHRAISVIEDNYLACRADQSRLAELQRHLATLCREWNTRYGHKPEACNPR